jgi:NAD+ kinase
VKPRALIVGDRRKPGVEAGVARHMPYLERRLAIVAVDLDERVDLSRAEADVVLIFGGDGSFLAVARRLGKNPIPVLGLDYGRFGFLAELQEDELEAGIEAFLAGRHRLSLRARLRCRFHDSAGAEVDALALNDVVVGRASLGRMVEVEVRVDGREAIRYAGDGLIVATATGSTAHALAAGGPILDPALDAILLVPICPHALGNRSLVLPGSSRIEMRVHAARSPAAVTVDGQVAKELTSEDVVEVEDGKAPLRVVRVSGRSFHDLLRTKLGWSGSPNYRSTGSAPPPSASPARTKPAASPPRP